MLNAANGCTKFQRRLMRVGDNSSSMINIDAATNHRHIIKIGFANDARNDCS